MGLPEDYRFAAEIDGADPSTYPGVYGVFPMTLAVPGPDAGLHQVPCAALSWVGVHPDHRRRGVLSAMIRHHLEQVHEEPGTHVSRPARQRAGHLPPLRLRAGLPGAAGRARPRDDADGARASTPRPPTSRPSSRPSPTRTSRPGCVETSRPLRRPRRRGRRRRLLRADLLPAAGAAARQGVLAGAVRAARRRGRRLRGVPHGRTSGRSTGRPASSRCGSSSATPSRSWSCCAGSSTST